MAQRFDAGMELTKDRIKQLGRKTFEPRCHDLSRCHNFMIVDKVPSEIDVGLVLIFRKSNSDQSSGCTLHFSCRAYGT